MEAQVDLSPRRIGRPPSCTCGTCHRCRKAAYMRAWWSRKPLEERRRLVAARDPERVRRYELVRSRTREKQDSVERSRRRHPERYAARVAVAAALRSGRLERQPCWCGNPRAEAHHPDYSQQLLVEWLCRRHHVARHQA